MSIYFYHPNSKERVFYLIPYFDTLQSLATNTTLLFCHLYVSTRHWLLFAKTSALILLFHWLIRNLHGYTAVKLGLCIARHCECYWKTCSLETFENFDFFSLAQSNKASIMTVQLDCQHCTIPEAKEHRTCYTLKICSNFYWSTWSKNFGNKPFDCTAENTFFLMWQQLLYTNLLNSLEQLTKALILPLFDVWQQEYKPVVFMVVQ